MKRGPGRPPGSINKSNNLNSEPVGKVKSSSGEPPEKKSKPMEKEAVAPLSAPAPATKQQQQQQPAKPNLPNPLKWNVQEVCDFIKNLPGCSDYVEDFAVQEIDGQALMLLGPDHLMTAMSIKLGPALKICEQVKLLRDEFAKN